MRRREFVAGLGAAVTQSRVTHAQQAKVARVGFLGLISPSNHAPRLCGISSGFA